MSQLQAPVQRPRIGWFAGLICHLASFGDFWDIIHLAWTCKFMYYHIFTHYCLINCPILFLENFANKQASLWLKYRKNKGHLRHIIQRRYLLSGISRLSVSYDFFTEYMFNMPSFCANNIIVYSGTFFKLGQIKTPLRICEYIYSADSYYGETRELNGWSDFQNISYIVPLFIVSQLVGGIDYPDFIRCQILLFNASECSCGSLYINIINNRGIKYFYWNECSFTWSDEPGDVYGPGSSSSTSDEIDTLSTNNIEIYLINVWHFIGIMSLLSVHKVFYKCCTKFFWKLMGNKIDDQFSFVADLLSDTPQWACLKDITIILEYSTSFDWKDKLLINHPNDPHAFNSVEWLWDWLTNSYLKIVQNPSIKSFTLVCASLSDETEPHKSDVGFQFDLKDIRSKDHFMQLQVKWISTVIRFNKTAKQISPTVWKTWMSYMIPLRNVLMTK